jgi:hypothetical protein
MGIDAALLAVELPQVITPRYFSLYSLIGAYSQPSGVAYCVPWMMYSVLGVTKVEPWLLMMLGSLTICLVRKSRRSMTATRALALSLMKTHWPS